MLSKLKKNNNEGFTIIEVMIVLAIAGLILLIVFLAVPALQRNARNTQRKNDAAGISGAVNEYKNNNSGTVPLYDGWTASSSTLTVCNTAANCTASTDAKATAKLGYYSGVGTGTGDVSILAASGTLPTAADRVIVYENSQCSGNAAVTTASRDSAVVYGVESGSGYSWQCVGS